MRMFKRDLIERYGVGHGAEEAELRKALKVRNTAFSVIALIVVGGLGTLWYFNPTAVLVVLLMIACLGVFAAVGTGIVWMVNELPDYMKVISRAKMYGVLEDRD